MCLCCVYIPLHVKKQLLFHYSKFTGWFYNRDRVFTARYGLDLYSVVFLSNVDSFEETILVTLTSLRYQDCCLLGCDDVCIGRWL